MSGGSKKQTVGYKYYLGEQMALCHGPVDKLKRIRIDARDVWRGDSSGGRITINKPDLFGGESREGGVSGELDMAFGGPAQAHNDYLVARLGSQISAYRGVVCAVLRQVYLGMNPYLKPWDFRLQRIHTRQNGLAQWYDEKAAIEQFNYQYLYDDQWKYRVVSAADGGAFGVPAEYIAADYDDSAWDIGPGGFGSGGPGAGLGVGTYVGAGCGKGIWIRKTVDFDHPSTIGDISLSIYHDDGVQVWWNGEQITTTNTGDYFHDTATIPFEKIRASNTLVVQVLDCIPGGSPSNIYAGVSISEASSSLTDMNPAHIVRECLTDPDWGLGYPEADIDDAAFAAAADALFVESFGLSLLWDRSIALEDFIAEVLRHIDAVLYVDRSSGKFVLELVRDDYSVGDLPHLDEDAISRVERFKRPALGELVNSINLVYWDAATSEDASLVATDLALMQLQGSVISDSVQYPGVTTSVIAERLLARDLRNRSTPLASCVVHADRRATDLHVGSPFRLSWDALGLTELVMRVGKIDYGSSTDQRVRIECVEDIFNLPTSIVSQPLSEWSDPVALAAACPYRVAVEAPYYELVQRSGEDAVDAELGSYPERGYLAISGARPSDDAIQAILMVDAGAGYAEAPPPAAFCPVAELAADVGRTDTVLAIQSGVDLDLVVVGTHVQIGSELCRVDALSDASVTVGRGVLDTVPAEHAAGAVLLFWDDFMATDSTAYASGETVSAKLLPVTGAGTLSEADAPADAVLFDQRAIRPYPPGKVQVNAEDYGEVIGGVADFVLSWAHRDRLAQTGGTLIDTTEGDIGPETGTTYRLRIYGETDQLVRSATIDGSSYQWTTEQDDSGLALVESDGDAYWDNVELLLSMEGTHGATDFVDKSPTPKSITAQGAAAVSTLQSRFGGASAHFTQLSDGLSLNNDFLTDTDTFTFECWVFLLGPGFGPSSAQNPLFSQSCTSAGCEQVIRIRSSPSYVLSLDLRAGIGGAESIADGTIDIPLNEWVHIAVTHDGDTWQGYVNGVPDVTLALGRGWTDTNGLMRIGHEIVTGYPQDEDTINGYIDELRLTKGVVRYSGTFTPQNAPFYDGDALNDPYHADVALLCHFNGLDGSTDIIDTTGKRSIAGAGGAQIATDIEKYGGASLYLDGDAYLLTDSSADFAFGTGDFTVEFWIYIVTAGGGRITTRDTDSEAGSWGFKVGETSYAFTEVISGEPGVTVSETLPTGEWLHMAAARESGTLRVFVNGVLKGTGAFSNDLNKTSDLLIGRAAKDEPNYWHAYLDDLRITKGVARYVGAFTPPDSQLVYVGGRRNGLIRAELESVRDGYTSYQHHNITVRREGYGFNYGYYYGGT